MKKGGSSPGEVRACDHVWSPALAARRADLGCVIAGRYRCLVRRVAYGRWWSGVQLERARGEPVFVGFSHEASSRRRAMLRALGWARRHDLRGTPGAEATVAASLRDWPDLYTSRRDVIDHLFFVVGNGYAWVDGGVLSETVTDHAAKRRDLRREARRFRKSLSPRLRSLLDDPASELPAAGRALFDSARGARAPQEPRPRVLYPVCEYSLITEVPDDVRPDWLGFAREAARLLRDDTRYPRDEAFRMARNRQWGERVCEELARRFGPDPADRRDTREQACL